MSEYANDEALVSAEWAKEHLSDPGVRFVEVDVDTTAYEQSHLPGAVGWNWTSQLADGVRRDIATREDFSELLSAGSGCRLKKWLVASAKVRCAGEKTAVDTAAGG